MPTSTIVTVTVAANTRDLTTSPAVRSLLDLTGDADDVLKLLIPQASQAIETYCNRIFARQTLSEQIRIWADPIGRSARRGIDKLALTQFPVASITSVTMNGTVLVAGTDYEADLKTGTLYRLATDSAAVPTTTPIHWETGKLVVVYVAGFILPGDSAISQSNPRTLPADVEDAAIRAIRAAYNALDRDSTIKSESVPGVYSVTYGGANGMPLPDDAVARLDSYRAPVVA